MAALSCWWQHMVLTGDWGHPSVSLFVESKWLTYLTPACHSDRKSDGITPSNFSSRGSFGTYCFCTSLSYHLRWKARTKVDDTVVAVVVVLPAFLHVCVCEAMRGQKLREGGGAVGNRSVLQMLQGRRDLSGKFCGYQWYGDDSRGNKQRKKRHCHMWPRPNSPPLKSSDGVAFLKTWQKESAVAAWQ